MSAERNEVAKLVKKLKSPDSFDREVAVAKLAGVRGSAVVEHLGGALSDSSVGVRRRAAQALVKKTLDVRLAEAGREKAFSFLGKAAADESPLVAKVAVEALEKKGGETVVPPLFAVLDSPSREAKILATGALMRIAAKLKGSKVSGEHAKALMNVYPHAKALYHTDIIARALKDALEGKIEGSVGEHIEKLRAKFLAGRGGKVPVWWARYE